MYYLKGVRIREIFVLERCLIVKRCLNWGDTCIKEASVLERSLYYEGVFIREISIKEMSALEKSLYERCLY